MNWEAIGAIGSILGAVGVIGTLVYLAAQIRQNSMKTRADIRQSLAEQQIQFINSRAIDPFLREALEKVYAGESLTNQEVIGVHSHCLAHIRLFENYFAQYELGTMDSEDCIARRKLIARHLSLTPLQQAFDSLRNTTKSGFAEEMAQILREIDNAG